MAEARPIIEIKNPFVFYDSRLEQLLGEDERKIVVSCLWCLSTWWQEFWRRENSGDRCRMFIQPILRERRAENKKGDELRTFSSFTRWTRPVKEFLNRIKEQDGSGSPKLKEVKILYPNGRYGIKGRKFFEGFLGEMLHVFRYSNRIGAVVNELLEIDRRTPEGVADLLLQGDAVEKLVKRITTIKSLYNDFKKKAADDAGMSVEHYELDNSTLILMISRSISKAWSQIGTLLVKWYFDFETEKASENKSLWEYIREKLNNYRAKMLEDSVLQQLIKIFERETQDNANLRQDIVEEGAGEGEEESKEKQTSITRKTFDNYIKVLMADFLLQVIGQLQSEKSKAKPDEGGHSKDTTVPVDAGLPEETTLRAGDEDPNQILKSKVRDAANTIFKQNAAKILIDSIRALFNIHEEVRQDEVMHAETTKDAASKDSQTATITPLHIVALLSISHFSLGEALTMLGVQVEPGKTVIDSQNPRAAKWREVALGVYEWYQNTITEIKEVLPATISGGEK